MVASGWIVLPSSVLPSSSASKFRASELLVACKKKRKYKSCKLLEATMVKIYRPDQAFAQAFLLQLAVVVLGAWQVILPIMIEGLDGMGSEENEMPKARPAMKGGSWLPADRALFVVEVTVASLLSCAFVFALMMRYAKIIIPLSYLGVPTFFATISLHAGFRHGFTNLRWTYAIDVVVFLFAFLSFWWARSHIDFAASTLEVSVKTLSTSIVLLALSASVLIAVWLVIWTVGVYGILTTFIGPNQTMEQWFTHPDGSAILPVSVFFCFLSLYWTVQVINNLVHTATARTVVAWWWNDKISVQGALQTCCTSLFGPICKGSLVVAAVQALDSTVSFVFGKEDRRRNNIGVDIGQAIVRLVARLVEYINYWTFVVLAVHVDYGSNRVLSYKESGEKLQVIRQRRGWSSFLTDSLAYSALWFMCLFIALLTSSMVYAAETLRFGYNEDKWPIMAAVFGFFASYMIASASLCCAKSAVRAVIICFAEFPERLRTAHPAEYTKLERGWSKAYPMAWADSNRRTRHGERQ